MKVKALFIYLMMLLISSCGKENQEAIPQEPVSFSIELIGQRIGTESIITYELEDNTLTVIMKVGTENPYIGAIDLLKQRYENTDEQAMMKTLSFGLQPYFYLETGQISYPCKFYHFEPPVLNQTGLRMILQFELATEQLDSLTAAKLLFNDPVFNRQTIALPLQIRK